VTLQQLYLALLFGSVLLLVAAAAVRMSVRTGLPSLLLYLAIGLGIGEAGLGIRFDDFNLTQQLGLIALAIILAEGGLSTRWPVIRPAVPLALVLATVGVATSVAVMAAGAHWILGLDVRTAVLLGAIVSSTDAAAVFSVLRRLPLRPRLRAALEAESSFNDPPVIILVTLVASDAWFELSAPVALVMVGYQLVLGAVIGLAVGWAGAWLLARSALPAAGLYPVSTLALTLLAFAAAGLAHASGFMAVYLAGLWLGNARLPHRRATLSFADGVAWLAQIGLFVLLGLLASPARLPAELLPGVVAGVVLTLAARPLSVLISTLPFRMPWREQAFLSWAGLRGAVPIVLTTFPSSAGLAGATEIFDIVFVLVVIFTLAQAPPLPWLARVLGVAETGQTREVEVEAAPLEEMNAELLQVRVPARSRLAGVYVDELRLPPGAAVTIIVRDGQSFVPDPATVLAVGDQLLIVATAAVRRATEQRLRAVSRAGKLARWYGEDGEATAR
jgi:cell volume regulation protein A